MCIYTRAKGEANCFFDTHSSINAMDWKWYRFPFLSSMNAPLEYHVAFTCNDIQPDCLL